MDWLKKLAGYAPDIAAAIASGGTSLAVTGLRILGNELLDNESATESEVAKAVQGASPDQMITLTRVNNEFKLEKLRIESQDKQSEHKTTQETIKSGDNSDSVIVRLTRPLHATASLLYCFYYIDTHNTVDVMVVSALLALPFAYSGLRQLGKWKTTHSLTQLARK